MTYQIVYDILKMIRDMWVIDRTSYFYERVGLVLNWLTIILIVIGTVFFSAIASLAVVDLYSKYKTKDR